MLPCRPGTVGSNLCQPKRPQLCPVEASEGPKHVLTTFRTSSFLIAYDAKYTACNERNILSISWWGVQCIHRCEQISQSPPETFLERNENLGHGKSLACIGMSVRRLCVFCAIGEKRIHKEKHMSLRRNSIYLTTLSVVIWRQAYG